MNIKLLQITFLILLIPVLVIGIVWAEDTDQVDTDDLEKKIEKYKEKLDDLEGKAKSLENEISYMNTQISLTEARIQNSLAQISRTQKQIIKLEEEIKDLEKRIDRLKESIEYQRKLLNIRARERYKTREINPMLVIFGSSTMSSLVKKVEYLKFIEIQDRKLLNEMERTKRSYNTQKSLFEKKKEEEVALKNKLEVEKANLDAYKSQLDGQKNEKKRLLEITQNDEEKYQKLLREAEKELAQITGAVDILKYHDGEGIKKGSVIGYQGDTGYSQGEHLHLGVYRYSSFDDIDGWDWYYSDYINPKDMLKKKNVYWNTGCESPGYRDVGKGSWKWPIDSPTVSQGFGTTCWSSRLYGGKPHPAYDMFGSYGAPVYAVEDGEAYFCRNCLGDGGNGVFIFHDNDYMTLYWHLR